MKTAASFFNRAATVTMLAFAMQLAFLEPSKAATNDTADTQKLILQTVPFTSQAPQGQWHEAIYQDGCEEASLIMALAWVTRTSVTPQSAAADIKKISDHEKNSKLGYHPDLSTEDTLKLLKSYYRYKNAVVKNDVTVKDIIEELKNGRLIIAPTNGRLLNNPNFTPPGPPHHMLVIIGYDPATDQFITNDPGTRKGKSYRYSSQVLYNAIRDYPTGFHAKTDSNKKDVIVVYRVAKG